MDEIAAHEYFDGLSLAWSAAILSQRNQAYTLFATHYFEPRHWLTVCPTSVMYLDRCRAWQRHRIPAQHRAGQSKLWSASCTTGGDPDTGHSTARQKLDELERNDLYSGSIQELSETNPPLQTELFRTGHPHLISWKKLIPTKFQPKRRLPFSMIWRSASQ